MGLEVPKVYGEVGIPLPPKMSPISLLKCPFFNLDFPTIVWHVNAPFFNIVITMSMVLYQEQPERLF